MRIIRSLKYYQDEKHYDLPFGTVYCVAGTKTNYLNIILCAQCSEYIDSIACVNNNYLNSNVVFLDIDNELFETKEEPTLYSHIIPLEKDADKGASFYVWHLKECNSEHLSLVVIDYYSELLQVLDSIVDKGDLPFGLEVQPDGVVLVQHISFSIGSREPSKEPFPDKLSRIEITPPLYKVLLLDYDKSFYFTAQVKAIYVLFLLHPEGILMKDFENYKDEYRTLYFKFTNRGDVDKIRQSVNRLFDSFSSNAISVKKSQCNSVIQSVIPNPNLRMYYLIVPRKGKPHTILLDRNLVSLPDDLLKKNW